MDILLGKDFIVSKDKIVCEETVNFTLFLQNHIFKYLA